jgi:hypothetical protein
MEIDDSNALIVRNKTRPITKLERLKKSWDDRMDAWDAPLHDGLQTQCHLMDWPGPNWI